MMLQDGREFDPHTYNPNYRYNTYSCPNHHHMLSCDIDKGVTPMFTFCRTCGQTAISAGYPAGPPPDQAFPVTMVWRKPTDDERLEEKRSNAIHYLHGGLAREWVHT